MARLTGLIRRQETTPNRTRDARKAFRGLVLHIAQGTYEGTISWQKNPTSKVSSEFVIGRRQGEWAQMMDLDDYGWTQREGNGYWVASENAGYVADGLTGWQVEANAQLLAWLHVHQGVPLQVADHPGERGLGHHSMDREWLGEEWGHDECPGSKVLSRKAEIVARAKQIATGEDDMALTPEALEQIQVAVWSANAGSKLHPVRAIDRLNATYAELAGKDFVDEPAIIAGVLTGLSPEAIAAAIPADLARQVADELAARLQG